MRILYRNHRLVPDYASLAAELDASAEALRSAGDRAAADRIDCHARRLRLGDTLPDDEPVLARWQ